MHSACMNNEIDAPTARYGIQNTRTGDYAAVAKGLGLSAAWTGDQAAAHLTDKASAERIAGSLNALVPGRARVVEISENKASRVTNNALVFRPEDV
jgi:hypothetical protein